MAELSKAAQEIEKDLAEYQERMMLRQAPAWRPEPKTTICGEVIGLRMGSSDFGSYPIVIYRNLLTNEIIAVHAFHTILRNKLAELKTDIGKQQWITYLGKQASRTRKDKDGEPGEYHNYDVENAGEDAGIGKEEGFTF